MTEQETPRQLFDREYAARIPEDETDHWDASYGALDAVVAQVRSATLREVEELLRSDDAVRRIGRASSECAALLVERRLGEERSS